ncbi:MAG: amidohydrolase [Candidatus Bathyarchaeota archaeon]
MQHADLVLKNANTLTMNPHEPHAEAIAIKDNKIVAVGTNEQVQAWIGNQTRVMNLNGKTVVPGFIDTHVHMRGFGRFLTTIDLREVNSIKKMQQLLQERVQKTPKQKWILGRGWDQEKFKEKRYPTREDLDEAAPTNPVIFTRVCGHICVVNSQALELADISRDTVARSGGQIDKNLETGEPTGILRENALDLVWNIVPEPSEEELTEICELACQKAVEAGLTSVHWFVQSSVEIRILQRLRVKNRLAIRIYLVVPVGLLDCLTDAGLLTGFGDSMIKIGSIKILADGSLGARTAALKQPYNDKPSTKGMMLYSQKSLNEMALKAHRIGFQLAIHCIGDQAVDMTLKALEKALKETPRENHRHRLEHVSVLNESLIQRMKRLGIVASVQPHFVVSDFWVVKRVGKARARWVYPFKTLIENGILVVGGSDCPVEPISPILGIYAAVNRKAFQQERITVEEAIRIYTANAAYASFEEKTKGSIEAGKLADLVVLSDDLGGIEPRKIEDVKVEMTIIGGKFVHRMP